jgi:hypothetical protein
MKLAGGVHYTDDSNRHLCKTSSIRPASTPRTSAPSCTVASCQLVRAKRVSQPTAVSRTPTLVDLRFRACQSHHCWPLSFDRGHCSFRAVVRSYSGPTHLPCGAPTMSGITSMSIRSSLEISAKARALSCVPLILADIDPKHLGRVAYLNPTLPLCLMGAEDAVWRCIAEEHSYRA